MEWRDVEGYEGEYLVSDSGLVKSLDRHIPYRNSTRKVKGVVLSLINKDGYSVVFLRGINKVRVHRLVAKAFIPNPNGYTEVNHKDCDKKHNHFSNLEWSTRSLNMKHAYVNGLLNTDEIAKLAAIKNIGNNYSCRENREKKKCRIQS